MFDGLELAEEHASQERRRCVQQTCLWSGEKSLQVVVRVNR